MPPSPWSEIRPHRKEQYIPTQCPPALAQEHAQFLSRGEGIICPPLPTLTGLEVEEEETLLLLSQKMNISTKKRNKYD